MGVCASIDGSESELCSPVNATRSSSTASSVASIPPSPLFETPNPLRHRHVDGAGDQDKLPISPSDSSVGSTSDDDEFDVFTPLDGMGHFDIETKKALRLDSAKYPTVNSETQHDIMLKYRQLHEEIKARGLYKCNYSAYAFECIRYAALAGTSLFCLQQGYYTFSAICLGAFWHLLVFTAHDAGHLRVGRAVPSLPLPRRILLPLQQP